MGDTINAPPNDLLFLADRPTARYPVWRRFATIKPEVLKDYAMDNHSIISMDELRVAFDTLSGSESYADSRRGRIIRSKIDE